MFGVLAKVAVPVNQLASYQVEYQYFVFRTDSSNKKHMDRGLQLAKQMLGEDASLLPSASAPSSSASAPSQQPQPSAAAAKAQVREYQYLAAGAHACAGQCEVLHVREHLRCVGIWQ